MPLEVRLGRFYRTRIGTVIGPIIRNENSTYPFGTSPLGPSSTWKANGAFYDNEVKHDLDLVEEVRADGQPILARSKAIDQMTLIDYRRGVDRIWKSFRPW